MDLNLKNKVIIVTGGAGIPGSIGETIVQSLIKEGAIPVVIDRNDRGFKMEEDFKEKGIDGIFIKTDLVNEEACKAAVEKTLAKYGRIDVLINNFGINDGVSLQSHPSEFLESIKRNVYHFFSMVHYSLNALKASKGNIINIGSKVAETGQGGTSGYAAAKGGVLSLTREWALDLRHDGIRVNCVMIAESWTPAYDTWINQFPNPKEKLEEITKRIPLGNRMTKPEEIADMVLFLASEKSSHTTAQHIYVDGGYTHLDRAIG